MTVQQTCPFRSTGRYTIFNSNSKTKTVFHPIHSIYCKCVVVCNLCFQLSIIVTSLSKIVFLKIMNKRLNRIARRIGKLRFAQLPGDLSKQASLNFACKTNDSGCSATDLVRVRLVLVAAARAVLLLRHLLPQKFLLTSLLHLQQRFLFRLATFLLLLLLDGGDATTLSQLGTCRDDNEYMKKKLGMCFFFLSKCIHLFSTILQKVTFQ